MVGKIAQFYHWSSLRDIALAAIEKSLHKTLGENIKISNSKKDSLLLNFFCPAHGHLIKCPSDPWA